MNFSLRVTFLDGMCAEAVSYYSDTFGINPEEYFTFGDKHDMLGNVPEEKSHYIYHAMLSIPGNPGLRLVLGDSPVLLFQDKPAEIIAISQHTTVEITDTDPAVIRKIYDGLMRKGKANQELGETPQYKLFGSLIDKYGVLWNLNCV